MFTATMGLHPGPLLSHRARGTVVRLEWETEDQNHILMLVPVLWQTCQHALV